MTDKPNYLDWAIRLQALAQAGLTYSKDRFDIERFEEIRDIACQILVEPSGLPKEKVVELFAGETGYQTPKIDTRAAIFKDQKILLVQEYDGLWTLPGGWCDVDHSIMDNTIKEVREEAGLEVEAKRLIAVLDKAKNNPKRSAIRVIKHFVLCRVIGGSFTPNNETLDAQYFALNQLPELAETKATSAQIALCFEANAADKWETVFD
ncbi:NUDIX hydrolase N-terminal domain-containing protein [Streptococcus plurextorum]|uniref:NUDIX hydrolase N-terminal domain-containing protein n=1 Tax=Streptococcus plurextorum TaxID=456876 RepID=UPI00040D0B95|nr:NUDIX hydrolase [Streptococcus plurextorum]